MITSGTGNSQSFAQADRIESTEVDLSDNDVIFDRICEISDRLGFASE